MSNNLSLTCLEDCCLASLCLVEVCPEEPAPAEFMMVASRCWTCFPLEEAASAAEGHWDMIWVYEVLVEKQNGRKKLEGSMEMGKNEQRIRRLLLYAVEGRRNTLEA